MKLLNLYGKTIDISINKYNIKWQKPREVSKSQKLVKDFLFPYWKADQCLEEARIPNSLLRIDLWNLSRNIIVEVSPRQHQKFNEFLHGDRFAFLAQIKRDEEKKKFAEINNIKFVELYEEDLKVLSVELFKEKFNIIL